jgi:AcrR family transcriptional regulator
MPRQVKSRRPYNSSGRRSQARRTRADVIAHARDLFIEHGYTGTTMAAVAARAGVSVETIYKSIGNKPAVLKAVLDVAIVGDDDAVPMLERPLVAQLRSEPDPRKILSGYGRHVVDSWPRQVPLQLILRAAAAVDTDAQRHWQAVQAERLTGMTAFANDLAQRGFLRQGLDVAEARDILWSLTAPEQYEVLVVQRGWAIERVGRFITDAMIGTLLPPNASVQTTNTESAD